MTILLASYRGLTRLSAPILRALLDRRLARGKEEAGRMTEKQGIAGIARPNGPVVWCHGASVGEALSILPLIDRLLAHDSSLTVLVTTTTVTSARLMAARLPERAIHQYAPLDHPLWVERFLDHWQPSMALWLESELWPNMLKTLKDRQIPAVLINARISDKSFATWQRFSGSIAAMLASFQLCLAQSAEDASRLTTLGAGTVDCLGNIKFSAPPLPIDGDAASALKAAIGDRPIWLAASTHPGEEEQIVEAHQHIAENYPDLLTVIAPRHPNRREEIATLLDETGLTWCERSPGTLPGEDDAIYLADTLGEMGLLFKAVNIVFMGGSLVPIGGHNPIEPALFSCAILHGPHMDNFRQVRQEMTDMGALREVGDAKALGAAVTNLLGNPVQATEMGSAAHQAATAQAAVIDHVFERLRPMLDTALAQQKAAL